MKIGYGPGVARALGMRSPTSARLRGRTKRAGFLARMGVGVLGLGLIGAVGVRRAAAQGSSAAQAEAQFARREMLNAEGSLLHRRIDLAGVMCWDRKEHAWHPLGRSTERLRVVNLWSAHCQPCREEFPLLRRMAAAWQHDRSVRFLFIADPPHDTEAAEVASFWTEHAAEVPELDPCRSTTERLRAGLGSGAQPLTLLLDGEGVVRQAFIGAIYERGLASAMERLLPLLAARPPQRR